MKQKTLFETDEALQDAEREIAELKEQLRETREESFRRLNRIAELEKELQKRIELAGPPAAIDAETKEKIIHHIRQIQAILNSI